VSELALAAQSAFFGHLAFKDTADSAQAGVTIRPQDDLALAIVMARKGRAADPAAQARAAFGLELPTKPKRVTAGQIAFIGMGPDQWLATEEGGDAMTFASRLAAAFGDSASISDQSDSRAILRLSGSRARDVLAKGLAVDLHPRAFGPGDAALSTIALIGAHLWQLDDAPTYDIAVFRSMAGSFADFIHASAAEFGIAVTS
jgi:sarcosine oxidase subunit gamma